MSAVLTVGPVVVAVERRAAVYSLVVVALLLMASVATLSLGSLGIPVLELPTALFGQAEGASAFALERLRGPRLATAILVGALLGISGTLFQTVTRNPLGSPDVIGLGAGAGAGAAIASLLLPGVPVAVGAIGGAVVAAALVFISTGMGFRSPARTIIAGIAVAGLAYAATQLVVSLHLRDAASQLAAYLVGSLNAVDGGDVLVAGAALAVVLPLAMALTGSTRLLAMGDDVAAGLGVDADRTRTLAILLSILAAGVAVAAAGPIGFVALTAPQIAQRVVRVGEAGVLPAALTGALVLVLSDLAAQQLPFVEGLPVGVLTLGVGGLYLGSLLLRERARGRL